MRGGWGGRPGPNQGASVWACGSDASAAAAQPFPVQGSQRHDVGRQSRKAGLCVHRGELRVLELAGPCPAAPPVREAVDLDRAFQVFLVVAALFI